jgi:hypothetical protein
VLKRLNILQLQWKKYRIEEKIKKSQGGKMLHDYVNLYFYARNPMLYSKKELSSQICILRISPKIIYIKNAVIVDRNASSDYARFYPSPDGIKEIDKDLVFAEYWTHTDDITEWKHKSIKCAEILIPDWVDSKFITGIYVSESSTKDIIESMGISLPVKVNSYLFFRR